MAQRVLLVCDMHDSDEQIGAQTLGFAVDGAKYEIDVCDNHAAALRDAVAPYIAHGRRAGGRASGQSTRRPRGARGIGSDRARTQQIREWARAHGHQVSDRGRIPSTVIDQFDAVH